MRKAVLSLSFILVLTPNAFGQDVWAVWLREAKRQCPSHHLEWICDECYDDFLSEFDKTLPAGIREKALSIADYPNRCASEKIGFSCEMSVGVDAYVELGLLKQFISFGCQRYKCEAPALCTTPASEFGKHH